jgi:outer membrane protein TolC
MPYMNVRDSYRLPRSVFAVGIVLLAVPWAVRAQPAQRGNAVPSAGPAVTASQPGAAARVLTLDEALDLAEPKSEQVTIATAGVTRAESQQQRVRSEWMPQVSAVAAYDRALASEFSGVFDNLGSSCIPLTVNPGAPLQDRVAEIERALRDCPPTGSLFGSGTTDESASDDGGRSLPFGQPNTYRINLAFSQNLYTGGRLQAQQDQAKLGRESAQLNLTSTRAQLSLDVAQAYFDAVLSNQLVTIAEATLAQAESTADQVRLQREAGRLAEFDLLRAQVSRDTQRPEVIRRRNERDLAHLRLKQLLDLPLDQPLQLVTTLEDAVLSPPAQRWASEIAVAEAGDAPARVRTAVTQAGNDVQQSEAGIRVARSQRLPVVSVNSAFGQVAYSGFPRFGEFRTNWTIGASASMPIFTGGRIKADETTARANLIESRARLQQTKELATLEEASTRLQLANARAAWESTAGIVQQAQRAYEIADLRYREGLSTQLELSDARLLLEQARNQRAVAAAAVQLARVRLVLLPELPVSAGAGAAAAQQQQMTQQQTTVSTPAAATAAPAASPRTGSQQQ